MHDVTAMGELLIDFTSQGTDDAGYPLMQAHPGGAPANYLAALAKMGSSTAMLGKVGQDTFGRLLQGTLRQAGIETSGLIMSADCFTTLAFVTLDGSGERSFAFARKPGADTQLRYEEVDLSLINDCRVFHFGSLSLTHEPARTATQKCVAYAKEQGKIISFDPNYRAALWLDEASANAQMLWGLHAADVVKISLEEVQFLFACNEVRGAEILLKDYGVSVVFITLGKHGCYYAGKNGAGTVPNYTAVTTVDTTGAGDIFGGCAMHMLLAQYTAPAALSAVQLAQAARFACTAASLSTQRYGGISSVPTRSEVDSALSE